MNVEFEEVEDIFGSYNAWCRSKEELFYRKAWDELTKGGMTSYNNAVEQTRVMIRAFTLIMIYGEFSELAFNEYWFYEFPNWQEFNFSQFRIGELIARHNISQKLYYEQRNISYDDLRDDEYDCDYEDDTGAVGDAFIELVENERANVFKGLKAAGDFEEIYIMSAMYLTTEDIELDKWKAFEETLEEKDRWKDEAYKVNDDVNKKKDTVYDDYEKDIYKYAEYIHKVTDNDDADSKVWNWINNGTYRLHR